MTKAEYITNYNDTVSLLESTRALCRRCIRSAEYARSSGDKAEAARYMSEAASWRRMISRNRENAAYWAYCIGECMERELFLSSLSR